MSSLIIKCPKCGSYNISMLDLKSIKMCCNTCGYVSLNNEGKKKQCNKIVKGLLENFIKTAWILLGMATMGLIVWLAYL